MNNKILSIFLIFIFLLSTISAAFADDKSYDISSADIFVDVKDNGLLVVNESYVYDFTGQFNGVYREIPLKDGESIENLSVHADGAYTKLEQTNEDGLLKIKVYLYTDEGLSEPISDKSVKIYYNYDFVNVTKVYNDVGELQFKVLGDDWDQDIHNFNAKIQFPGDGKLEYWINPASISVNQSWDKNVLSISTDSISSDEYIEVRAIIPLADFSNPIYARHINENGYDKILEIQENYQNEVNFENTVDFVVPILLILTLIYPVAVYMKYGREPKVKNDLEYMHEPPSEENPVFVDAMFSTKSDVGKSTNNGIQAAIMEMIDDGQIKLVDKNVEKKTLKLILPTNIQALNHYERDIVNLLKPFEEDGVVDLKNIDNMLGTSFEKKEFSRKKEQIKKDYYKEDIEPIFENYFIDKGSMRLKFYSIFLIIASVFYLSYLLLSNLNINIIYYIISVMLIIISVVIFMLPNRIGGRWTEKGIEEFNEWKAFERFLNDFSLIKEHPPESIAIWNKYLVYATAFGNADAVKEAMGMLNVTDFDEDELYYYLALEGPIFMNNAFNVADASNASSGAGSVGGGSGGGGGGAF